MGWLPDVQTKEGLASAARILLVLASLILAAIWWLWPASRDFVLTFDAAFKVVGYALGPVLAVVSWFWARATEIEIREREREIGRLEQQAEQAQASTEREAKKLIVARAELKEQEAQNRALSDDLQRITKGSDELWKIRLARPFDGYLNGMRAPSGAKIITVGNLKGGVGKTTIAANLGAYISEARQKPVLLIDLDFQASLTNMLLLSIDRDQTPESINALLADGADLREVVMNTVHLAPKLPKGWLIPAAYELSRRENQLLLEELIHKDNSFDVRYRIAHALLRPEVRERYHAIIIDMPPRMSVAAVNALVASHHLLIPTVLDRVSTEAISQFLTMMRGIKADLNLDLKPLGVVANMTKSPIVIERDEDGELDFQGATAKERSELVRVFEAIEATWPGTPVIKRSIQRRVSVSGVAGEDIAYVQDDAGDRQIVQQLFDPVAEEICSLAGL